MVNTKPNRTMASAAGRAEKRLRSACSTPCAVLPYSRVGPVTAVSDRISAALLTTTGLNRGSAHSSSDPSGGGRSLPRTLRCASAPSAMAWATARRARSKSARSASRVPLVPEDSLRIESTIVASSCDHCRAVVLLESDQSLSTCCRCAANESLYSIEDKDSLGAHLQQVESD